MTTATAPGNGSPAAPVDPTGELLRRLGAYLTEHTGTHPALVPALTDLDQALDRYIAGAPDAGARAVAVYRSIDAVRQADPAVPAP